jgi:hypothetical protein
MVGYDCFFGFIVLVACVRQAVFYLALVFSLEVTPCSFQIVFADRITSEGLFFVSLSIYGSMDAGSSCERKELRKNGVFLSGVLVVFSYSSS